MPTYTYTQYTHINSVKKTFVLDVINRYKSLPSTSNNICVIMMGNSSYLSPLCLVPAVFGEEMA